MKIIDFPCVISKRVDSYDQILHEVSDLKKFVTNKKNFAGKHKKMFAIHHSQVSATPYNFFVLHPKLVLGQGDQVWRHRVIINPEVTWINEETIQDMLEACASFPFHSPVKAERALHIKVKYQIPTHDGQLETIEEEMANLKAEIFQHETEHGNGYSIYFPFREPKEQV